MIIVQNILALRAIVTQRKKAIRSFAIHTNVSRLIAEREETDLAFTVKSTPAMSLLAHIKKS